MNTRLRLSNIGNSLPLEHVEICGIPVAAVGHLQVLQQMKRKIDHKKPGNYISITNTESMYHALRTRAHFDYIREANFSLCDGVGVILAGLVWGHSIRRYNGPILLLDCCAYGQARGWRHFFYGGKAGVADKMAARLKKQFPSIIIAGTYSPPFGDLTPEMDASAVAMINAAKPDIVWVGLGLLKQERWIARHLDRLTAPWMIGVGAAFDYHSGTVPWAPKWVRALGMEWLFRLLIQPRLRAKRYWWSLIFLIEAAIKGAKARLARDT
jgi:N-acetylglucosaminyldiphosphoundecaprenol N-acetyl-beta-D-mannosaminyltransferase